MIALIGIPHQTKARLRWYEDEKAVIAAAVASALDSDRSEPDDLESAIHTLADDWSGYLLVQRAADLEWVELHVKNHQHQAHVISAMLEEFPN